MNRYSKFRNIRTHHAGYSFASKLEAELFDYLKLFEKAGEVTDIKVQQHIYLTKSRIKYIADFSVWDNKLGEPVFWEAKGFETPEWKLKKRLYAQYGPARLRIYYNKRIIEEIIPSTSSDEEA